MPWLVAAALALATIVVLYPGQYPFDAAYQLWQARSGQFNNISPVAMTAAWSALLAVGASPAALFCLNMAMYWTGIALSVAAISRRTIVRAVLTIALGMAPLALVEMAHVLSDAHLAAVLVLASGLAAAAAMNGRTAPRFLCIVALVYAGAVRHNALPAILPFGAVLALTWRPARRRGWRVALVGAAALGAFAAAGNVLLDQALTRERATVWPSIALWDLAAISVDRRTLLLPPFTRGWGLTVDELIATGAFDPASNTFLFRKSRSGVRDGLAEPYSQTELRELRAAWVDAVARYPAAYLRHRLRTFWLLIGPHRGAIQGMPYLVNRSTYRDNPPLPQIYAPAAQYRFYALADALRPTWLFAALPYLLSAGVALVLAWVGGRGPGARLALSVSGSALLYAAGFVLLAPGAELRYLTWPIVAGPLALAFALASCVTGSRSARSCIRPDPVRTRSPSYRP